MKNLCQIQRVSKRFRLFFVALIICMPLLSLVYWMAFNNQHDDVTFILHSSISGKLDFTTRLFLFAISLIPVSVAMFGAYTLAKLFKLYENAIVFSAENVKHYRALGFIAIFWVIAEFIRIPLASLAISLNNPPGERFITMGLELVDIATLIIGSIIVLISWVMEEGRRLEDEQAHTI